MILRLQVPGGRVLADETACLLLLGDSRTLVRTDTEYEAARGLVTRLTWAGDRQARLDALRDAYEHHIQQAGEALLRRADLAAAPTDT